LLHFSSSQWRLRLLLPLTTTIITTITITTQHNGGVYLFA